MLKKTFKTLYEQVFTTEQKEIFDHYTSERMGWQFHSFFKDGSVELSQGDMICYIERDGQVNHK